MSITPVKRKRLETQGFIGLNDEVLGEVEPWLRLSPALCTILIGLGTALAFAPLLWVMVAFAGLGAIFPTHPFDLIYNYGLRYLSGTKRLPPNGAPRRFACGLAAAWLVGTALAFQVGVLWLGYVLGGLLTAVGLLVTLTHFCIPSIIYQALFGHSEGKTV